MSTPRIYRHTRFLVPAAIVLLVGAFITYRALRPTSYQLYKRIKVGDSFADLTARIGQPVDSHETTNGTDYLFAVRGHPDYPSMMGVPFLVHRIVRMQNGRVVSKGAYEDYYDPYAPGWAPKRAAPIEVPAQFRFITFDTSLEDVVRRVGQWNRIRGTNVLYYQWNLPDGSAVLVGPEPPFQLQSRIRGVTAYRSTNDIPPWL
jgi:hypothetical protein